MRKILISLLVFLMLLTPVQSKEHKTLGISRETQCLADNIYFEARGEPFKGKVAVALVTINRTKSDKFPRTICGVVYQKGQFTWTANKHKITDFTNWTDSLLAASMAMEDSKILGDFKATHYHNDTVAPAWGLRKVAKIGKHTFYS